MLRKLGMTFAGRPHRGIDDCRNIARLAKHLADNDVALSITGELGRTPKSIRWR